MFVNETRNDWDDHLPFIMMAYRSSVHESTKCSPNLLMFGRELMLPTDIMYSTRKSPSNFTCPSQFVEWLRNAMKNAYEKVAENLQRAAERQNKAYARGLKPRQFQENDMVWRWYPPNAKVKLGLGSN